MIAMASPHPDQVRYFVQSALNGFCDLPQDHAVANARDELAGLLAYLDRFADYAVPVFGRASVEPWVRFEGLVSEPQGDDLADLEGARA